MIEITNPFRDREAERRRKIRNTLLAVGAAGIAAGAAAATWWMVRKKRSPEQERGRPSTPPSKGTRGRTRSRTGTDTSERAETAEPTA